MNQRRAKIYQKRCNRGVSEGPESAPVGVGDESSDQRRKISGAAEDVGHLRGRDLRHVEPIHQVNREVRRQPHARHFLERLVPLRILRSMRTPI